MSGVASDSAAVLVEEHGKELAESFLFAARKGDRRAAEGSHVSHLRETDRDGGTADSARSDPVPDRVDEPRREARASAEALVAHVPPNPAIDVIRAMSLEEKVELLGRLREGELVSTAAAPPTIEAVPRSR
jgi:hypothetical protein